MLTPYDLDRYDRQIMLDEIGKKGQAKLKDATVLVAGAGGLGSPIATYLAAAGVGHIRLVDNDTVDLSNLNRQVLHWDRDIDRLKVESAMEKLRLLNPTVTVEALSDTITGENAREMASSCQAIVDAMDNLPTRHDLNKAAMDLGIPFFHGAVYGFEGRAMTVIPGESACFRCLYSGSAPQEKFPVLGTAPAVIAGIQVTEVVKYLVGAGKLLTGRLLVYDGLEMSFEKFKIERNPECDHCGHLE
jgi:molybdopterin-synthase adenylyltransferase